MSNLIFSSPEVSVKHVNGVFKLAELGLGQDQSLIKAGKALVLAADQVRAHTVEGNQLADRLNLNPGKATPRIKAGG